MKSVIILVVLITVIVDSAVAAKLPSYLKPCNKNDPKLDECTFNNIVEALPSIMQGDPELNIPPLDPLVIDKIVIGDEKKQSENHGLTFSCEQCKISGLKQTKLKKFKFDLKKQHVEIEGDVPVVEIEGKYTALGKVLLLAIEGEGDVELKLTDINLDYKADYDLKKGKDGKEYITIKNSKIKIKPSGFNIKLTNLFKGDQKLGDQVNVFLNKNGREVLKLFTPTVGDTITDTITTTVNGLTEKVPFDELFLK